MARVNGRLAIARAIGDRDERCFGVDCIPDYVCCDLNEKRTKQDHNGSGDFKLEKTEKGPPEKFGHLLLACDGLWDVMSPEDCLEVINDCEKEVLEANASNTSTTNTFQFKTARMLTKTAFNKFSTDNISVICIELENYCWLGNFSSSQSTNRSKSISPKLSLKQIFLDLLFSRIIFFTNNCFHE